MKKISSATIMAILSAVLIFSIAYALVGNGDFEAGDYTGWTKSSFINNGFSAAAGSGGVDLSTIVGGVAPLSLSDPRTNNIVQYPAYGSFSAKVNDETSYTGGGHGQNANTISQTLTPVLDSNGLAHIRFTYSAVMVNPVGNPHTDEEKPYFRIQAVNSSNGNDVIFDFSSYVGEPGKNWQNGSTFNSTDFWQYLDWTHVDLASSPAHPVNLGDQIILTITAAGCSLGGHPGYVYIDEITDGEIAGPSINATGPASANAGDPITYTYTVKNYSLSSINPIVVITPPTDVTFNSLGDAVNCSGFSPVTCSFTGVAAGSQFNFTVSGNISAGATPGIDIAHGDYTVSASGFPTVGGQTVLTSINGANLTITATGAASLKPGEQYVYTFNYTTDNTANNTQVEFTLPSHTTYVSDSGSFCSVSSGVVTCNLGSISANGSFTVTTLVDKLKKIGTNHVLNNTAYQISATGTTPVTGIASVTASVITPFADVNIGHWAIDYIQSIWAAGITGGCANSPLSYCPNTNITRAEMAIYVERGIHTSAFNPGTPTLTFTDTSTHYAKYWIEALKADGITSGCSATQFCPNNGITRAQAAIFLLRGKFNSSHVPPTATGTVWLDVPASAFAAAWMEEMKTLGISSGCGAGNYCPNSLVTRAEMAVLVQRTFLLTLPTP